MAQIDDIDIKILENLEKNSRISLKEMGNIVHMTGQAVAARISKLEDIGVIEGYSIKINKELLGNPIMAIVTVFMKTTNHASFHKFVQNQNEVIEAFRISGEGCYSLKVAVASKINLTQFLDKLLIFGNYRVNLSLSKIK